jgi:DNA-binding GntR family transcriptional regulator
MATESLGVKRRTTELCIFLHSSVIFLRPSVELYFELSQFFHHSLYAICNPELIFRVYSLLKTMTMAR